MVKGVDNKSSVTADADAGGRHHSSAWREIGATFILVCVEEALLGWLLNGNTNGRRMDLFSLLPRRRPSSRLIYSPALAWGYRSYRMRPLCFTTYVV